MKADRSKIRKPSIQQIKRTYKRQAVNSATGHYQRSNKERNNSNKTDKTCVKSNKPYQKQQNKQTFANYLKSLKNQDLQLKKINNDKQQTSNIHINLHLSIKDTLGKQKTILRAEQKTIELKTKESSRIKSHSQHSQYDQSNYFDDIQFFRQLGRGAHAVVKSAVDYKRNRKIAVKFYIKKGLSNNQLNNINNQIDILKQLSHQNIAALYDVAHTSKEICLIMEYGGGNSLYQYLKSNPNCSFTQQQAKCMFKQILRCIIYIHSLGIVHRDIKPQNILLNKYKKLKLIDFGFAIKSGPSSTVKTFCGTPTYMAPQVVSKRQHIGLLADRWSLGVLLYTMLQGTYPFKAPTQKQLFNKIVKGNYEYVRTISKSAQQVISSLLVIEPTLRADPNSILKMDWLT